MLGPVREMVRLGAWDLSWTCLVECGYCFSISRYLRELLSCCCYRKYGFFFGPWNLNSHTCSVPITGLPRENAGHFESMFLALVKKNFLKITAIVSW